MSCCLSTTYLSADPLYGLLPETGDTLQADPTYYPCCEGKGWRYCLEADAVQQCALQERIGKVHHLLSHPFAPTSLPKSEALLGFLRFTREQQLAISPRGKLLWKKVPLSFHSARKPAPVRSTPSLGFGFAAACTWQLGLSALWIPLGEDLGETLPIWLSRQETPDVCWVEQRKPMWQRQVREDFAAVIRWCDAAAIPLWAELHPAPTMSPLLRRRSAAVDQILNQAKSRPTLEWLDEQSRSRFEMVTMVDS